MYIIYLSILGNSGLYHNILYVNNISASYNLQYHLLFPRTVVLMSASLELEVKFIE